jgi:transcriptional accessory protein Tex/SPT6
MLVLSDTNGFRVDFYQFREWILQAACHGCRTSLSDIKLRKLFGRQLLKVAKLGPKAYEQCAGFMRISDGKNPLDATGVHPESYAATKQLLETLGYTLSDVTDRNVAGISKKVRDYKKLAQDLEIGELTLRDIVKELETPARDPREDMPKPILRSDVLEIKDLTPGMVLKGTVRNVIDFGAFVDIGVHQDGLVHISQMCDRFIKHPLEVVSVGDIVEVKVLSVDVKKQRIQREAVPFPREINVIWYLEISFFSTALASSTRFCGAVG